MYSNCYVQLQYYQMEDFTTFPVKFRGFGDELRVGHQISAKRFEAYKAHGKYVRVLTIRRESKYIGSLNFSYFDAITQDPPMFSRHFTTAFQNLKTIVIDDRASSDPIPAEYMLGSITNILTTLPNLKDLNLHLYITHTSSEDVKGFIESQEHPETAPISVARLQSFTIDVHVYPPVYPIQDLGIGNWLLSALPPLLQPSFNTINSLSFLIAGQPDPGKQYIYYGAGAGSVRDSHGTLNPLNRKFSLPNLRCLRMPVFGGDDEVLTEFVTGNSFEKVEEVEVRSVTNMSPQALLSLLKTRFPRLKTLHLKNLDSGWAGVDWGIVRDIRQEIPTLKTIKIHIAVKRSRIEMDLGTEFLKTVKVFITEGDEFRSGAPRVVFEF
ncbi:hypothetical protein TWF481_002243 [Arthrobotrys musiformis]|uniref:F-box domain-containing protein n=1 Tax=Arthrobotrys musiformis TaxID=47236 RepID=A0AAV9VUM5_9PEZI